MLAGPGVFVVDAHTAVSSGGDRAAPAELAQGLVDPHPRGAHEGRQVCLGEAHRDARPFRGLLSVFAGEGEELRGDSLNGERAQRSLAVPLSGWEAMLLDVSGGTVLLRQLEAASVTLESVRHLFVSHRHFDHAGSLAPLLVALTALPAASLTVHALAEILRASRELLALTIPGVEDWIGELLLSKEPAPGKSVRAGEGAEVTPFEVHHVSSVSASLSRKAPPLARRAR